MHPKLTFWIGVLDSTNTESIDYAGRQAQLVFYACKINFLGGEKFHGCQWL